MRAGDPESKTKRLKTSDDSAVFSYLRKNADHEVLVILNLSNADLNFSINDEMDGKFREVFFGAEKDFSNDRRFEMKAWEFLVFERVL